MKIRALLVAVAVMAAVLPAVSAYAESSSSLEGQTSADLRFAVRIPHRISVQAQENNGQVDVRVASMGSHGDVVAVNTNGGLARRANGGSAFSTSIRNDGNTSVYTIAIP